MAQIIPSAPSSPPEKSHHHPSLHLHTHMRARHDDDPEDWWFASIAIPLLAATIGPLANVLSIAALVSYWREDLNDGMGGIAPQLDGTPIKDPHWATGMNVASLVTGYVGNAFLFFNMTNRVRYIVALPMTVFLWVISATILVGITAALAVYDPPVKPTQIYSQAYWYAVIAAVLYALCAILLMVNMVGYMLGHYTERFNLTDAQRTLILQTFMFFIWLAGGAGVFTAIEGWSYSNALYYCDVTILTIGFGDLTPHNSGGRGLVIPYALGGVLILGLMVSSISRFATELGEQKVVRKRFERSRSKTLERARGPSYSEPIPPTLAEPSGSSESTTANSTPMRTLTRAITWTADMPNPGQFLKKRMTLKSRLLVLREEKDRFEQMRRIQSKTDRFKKYTTLSLSFGVLVVIWIVGALVFWQLEQTTQGMTFFEAFYFCYVSLTTIGYGDFTPQSAGGRPFFVVWSLFAVPSITILIGAASNTVVESFNNATNKIADFTLLPKHGIWRNFLEKHTPILGWITARDERLQEEDRIEQGFPVGPDPAGEEDNDARYRPKTIEQLALENPDRENRTELGRRLAHAIKQVTNDIKSGSSTKKYTYEEWVEWTILIRFTSVMQGALKKEVDHTSDCDDDINKGLIEWDWLGEDSPMMAEMSEPEWLLDRLIESMARYTRNIVAFLRIEKERGYVIDGAIAEESDGDLDGGTPVPGPRRNRRPTHFARRRGSSGGGRAPDERSLDYEDPEEEEVQEADHDAYETPLRAARKTSDDEEQAAREKEVETSLAKEEKQWDDDYEARNGRTAGQGRERRNSREYQGLPGFMGEMDYAWKEGRNLEKQDLRRQQ